ncbi:MAG: hypothetical protein JNL28_07370 [Planctomycetes bacterium]|nr:hypothetical protein [Planctomycetota bacterium]
MKNLLRCSTFVAALLCTSSAFAQTFPEVEPNSVKASATPIVGINAGGSITGTSTGTGVVVGDTAVTTADVFRVQTGALPLGIYLHSLTLTSSTTGNSASIRSVTQTAGAPNPGTDGTFQTSNAGVNKWYGFGKQEEIYYRVTGGAASTAQYAATLSTSTITPIVVAGLFNPGSITVSTQGQGHTTDTEIYLYDGNLDPVPLGHNDDIFGVGVGQSRVVVTLTAGTYYVAVANYNTANNQGDSNPGENFLTGPLLDFPNALANTSTTANVNVAFSVTDGGTTTPVAATRANAHEVVWAVFTVQVNTNPPANDNCAAAQNIATGTYGGILTYATNDGAASCDPGGASSRDVWFSFTDPSGSGGTLSLNTCGTSGADTVLSVHSACGGAELACSDDCGGAPCGGPTSCLSVVLAANQTVKIRLSEKGLGGGLFTLNSSYVGNPPSNDLCANPIVIGQGTFAFDTTLATSGETVGTCSSLPGKNLWYTYAAQTNGNITVSTCGGTTGDTEIWIYDGAGCPVNPAIACNDDSCGLQSSVTFASVCGSTYTIEIANFSTSATVNITGTFTVSETGTGCSTPSTPICLGDGTGAPCPCGNTGAAGHGCGSNAFAGGAILTSAGIAGASPGTDTLVLTATDIPGPGLFFQSNGLLATPANFGDGHLCAAVGIIRLGVVFPTAGVASYPGGLTPNPIHIQGGTANGQTKHYQCWYRSVPGLCGPNNYDLTQGLTLVWGP